MEKKTIFITIAIIALLVQLTFPMWWGVTIMSIWLFVVEGIIEGGLFEASYYSAYQYVPLAILFFFYSIIAIISPIWAFFSIKKLDSEQTYTKKKNIVFLIVNILTIILSIIFIILNKGFIPRL